MDGGHQRRRLALLMKAPPVGLWNCWWFRSSVRPGAGLRPLWGFTPFGPGIREVALRRLQDHLLLVQSPSGPHLGVIRRERGGGRRK